MHKIFSKAEELLAIVIPNDVNIDGIEFYTNDADTLQLGAMKRAKGYEIKPHVHLEVERTIYLTQECLFVRKGLLRVNLFDSQKRYESSIELRSGDVILLVRGGHSFDFIEDSEIIEVKQGPFCGNEDKQRF